MKTTVALILFAISAFAQEGPAQLGPHAACGPVGVNFKTETSVAQSLPQPEPGKALVYVVEDFPGSSETIGAPTIKVGIDGNWVGATQGRSYLYLHRRSRKTSLMCQLAITLGGDLEARLFCPRRCGAGKDVLFSGPCDLLQPLAHLPGSGCD
jgi:hypothetical protein